MSDLTENTLFSPGGEAQPSCVNPADVRLAAMNLLARREQSRRELEQKLVRRFGKPELVDRVLQDLADEGLQSDRRFAESFLRQRIARGQGPLRIRQEVRQRGIDDAEINAALVSEAPDWFALAERVYRHKFGDTPPADIKEKARRCRFMQYRGFTSEHFQHLLP